MSTLHRLKAPVNSHVSTVHVPDPIHWLFIDRLPSKVPSGDYHPLQMADLNVMHPPDPKCHYCANHFLAVLSGIAFILNTAQISQCCLGRLFDRGKSEIE